MPIQESDIAILGKWVEEVLEKDKNVPLEFLIGQVMKKSSGRANPEVVRQLLVEKGVKG